MGRRPLSAPVFAQPLGPTPRERMVLTTICTGDRLQGFGAVARRANGGAESGIHSLLLPRRVSRPSGGPLGLYSAGWPRSGGRHLGVNARRHLIGGPSQWLAPTALPPSGPGSWLGPVWAMMSVPVLEFEV